MASTLTPNPPQDTSITPSQPIPSHPPKSKTQPYYSIHPLWSDITPIPLVDLSNPSTYTTLTSSNTSTPISQSTAETLASAGPALATIAYTPRYAEAMSYLRAVMVKDEKSQRALELTEDVIGMNAAHYTVWIYRMGILKGLWGVKDSTTGGGGDGGDGQVEGEDDAERVRKGVEEELRWLEGVSERNLKNYQIWHHRTSLLTLLPTLPKNEQTFLSQILSLDTKNYHVWSYRQWLCTRFPTSLLSNNSELKAMDQMIFEDALNNSAWNHRWWICFGVDSRRRNNTTTTNKNNNKDDADVYGDGDGKERREGEEETKVIDLEIIDRELEFTKSLIRKYPQNGSSWNYLKGIIKFAGIDVVEELKGFCGEFVGRKTSVTFPNQGGEGELEKEEEEEEEYDLSIKNTPSKKGVRSSQAVEMLIEIYDKEGNREKVREGLKELSRQWDPIRERYWMWRLGRLEERWKKEDDDDDDDGA